jgi:hypothetical protein
MSDGTDAGFLFVRLCPGFLDGYPGPQLTKLDDAEFESALKKDAKDAVGRRMRGFEKWRKKRDGGVQDFLRRRMQSAIARPGKRRASITARHGGAGQKIPTDWDQFVEHLSFLGRTISAPLKGQLASPRIFFADDLTPEEAEKAIAALEYAAHSSTKSRQLRDSLCPRYGYLSAEEVSAKERIQYREGMRQFWEESQTSSSCWYHFARQLHPDQIAIWHAIGRPGCGGPEPVRERGRRDFRHYSNEQKKEMNSLLDSIMHGWGDPSLTAHERVSFERQQIMRYTGILDSPAGDSFDELRDRHAEEPGGNPRVVECDSADSPALRSTPQWDPVSRKLHWKGLEEGFFDRRAKHAPSILQRFQQMGWPETIPSPYDCFSERDRLDHALSQLRWQTPGTRRFRHIWFESDSFGTQLKWLVREPDDQLTDEPTELTDQLP